MSPIPVRRFPPRYGPAPKLKPVEAQEVEVDGQRLVAVQRPRAGPGEGVLVSPEGMAIAAFFDGAHDLRAVQKAIFDKYNQLLYVERIHELANALSKAGLLEDAPVVVPADQLRRPAHAGSVYEADPSALTGFLDGFYTHEDGPGAPPAAGSGGGRLLGLVTPHIDYHRGGAVYAHAYKALVEGSDADLFVVFGTAHASPTELFTLTRRHYDTPFGPLPTDLKALKILEQELGESIFRDESVHDEEHSIELQAVFLKHVLGGRRATMLPILCSSLYACAAEGRRPDSEPALANFLQALGKATAGRNVLYVAAADLSHVGKMYGDAWSPSAEDRRRLAQKDLESLERFCEGDAERFFDHVGPDGDTRRICGLTPMYMLLKATGGTRAKLLKYAQWFGQSEGSAVTYAAATIER